MTGNVHGGQQPVSGSSIYLYAANATSTDGASTLLASTTTTSNGNFTLPTWSCPSSASSTYLVAKGGNSGLGGTVNNSALTLMTALGPCGSLTSSVFISVNEQTTVAAVGVLYPYMTSYANIGATSQATLTSAFSTVSEYVNSATGQLPGPMLPSGYYGSQEDIVTVADILAPCINSTGQDTNCASLFALLGSPMPTDTIGAAIYLFNHPTTANAGSLFDLISPTAPYQPTLPSAPTTYALSITAVPATPTISPNGGTFTSNPIVTISDATSGVGIYYTTNGTTPTTGSTLYPSYGFTMVASGTVEAIAVATNGATSAVGSAAFTVPTQTATPAITSAPGSLGSIIVTITDATPGAVIYYTYSGQPTTSSTVYGGPITLIGNGQTQMDVFAVAQAPGDTVSNVASGYFDPCDQASPPSISPGGGTFSSPQTVTMYNSFDTNGPIYYSIGGSGYTAYYTPITVSSSETIQAYAYDGNLPSLCNKTSPTVSATFTINLVAATPTFTPVAGSYASGQTVTISSTTTGASIYYTTDGSTPTTTSTLYTSALTLSGAETINAIAVESGYANSAVGTAAYIVAPGTATPVITAGPGMFSLSCQCFETTSFTISDVTPGAVIYYAIGTPTATTSWTVYTGSVPLNGPVGVAEVVSAVAQAPGDAVSSLATTSLTQCGQDSQPYFLPGGGTYSSAQNVTIYNPNGSGFSTLYFSINGAAYTAGNQVTVSTSETLRAYVSGSPNGTLCPSNVTTATYVIQ